ncbi:hypothetical protein, conserved [Leishmania tarentolae]|uniref:Leucine-rich repeat protein n=1 Tax=Leishmania tarentolae TaxID=5689 RepID=A0A640KT13_LEITA|nr:hypothetical protein, conserved [Leishmania tarentolae]
MSCVTLSSVVRANPRLISSSLEKMSCNAQGITVVDIYPSVLSALTSKGAPVSVAESARMFVQAARCSRHAQGLSAEDDGDRVQHRQITSLCSTVTTGVGNSNLMVKKKSAANEDSYLTCFNVGIAMSLHTVLLSRNRISSLLGIVQFKHCVCLSLLGNRIRTIEDCEPLALLPDLQYLSLEYNPVTRLPHYRAHLLRICSWPQELSPSTCRLRKLDSAAITTSELKHAMLCLLRESALLPELLYRMQLLAFLVDIENRQRLHRELRLRGFLLHDLGEQVSMELLLERGVAHALSRVGVAGAAHMARQLVRDRRLLRTASTAPSPHSNAQPATEHAHTHISPTHEKSMCEALDEKSGRSADVTITSVTNFGSDTMDPSDIASVSTVSSCSLFSNTSSSEASVLQSLSHLLASKELDWSQRSLRRADAMEAADTCKAWSKDAFRQTIVSLDVRLCVLLLRISRVLGQMLTSHDVDHLCKVWMHAVVHCTPAEAAEVNVTGPRRLVVEFGAAAAERKSAKRGAAEAQAALKQQGTSLGAAVISQMTISTSAQVESTIKDAPEKELRCLSSTSSSPPRPKSHNEEDVTTGCTKISTTSLCSDTALVPRDAAPLPTIRSPAEPMQPSVLSCEATGGTDASAATHSSAQDSAPLKASTCAESAHTLEVLARGRCKRRVFQQWCSALRHRWQTRILIAYIREKVSDAAAVNIRSPSWGGILAQVTYVERKRGFFTVWRRRAQLRRVLRTRRLCQIWNMWRQKAAASSILRIRCEQTSALAAQHRRNVAFRTWKLKAEKRASERCIAARRRILTEGLNSTDTFLARASLTPVMVRMPSSAPSPRISVLRHTLADALTPHRETCTTAVEAASVTSVPDKSVSDTPVAVARNPVITSVWRPVETLEKCICPLHASAPVSDMQMQQDCCAQSSSDEEAGLSAVGASPSPGVSATSGTITPFSGVLFPEGVQQSQQLRDATKAQTLFNGPCRELSPPPAIRMLFPPEQRDRSTDLNRRSHPIDATSVQSQPLKPSRGSLPDTQTRSKASAIVLVPSVKATSYRSYGSFKPSCLPSTTAARRAIVRASSRTEAEAAKGGMESPYPPADVEALVERAKQLERHRDYLIETVQSLHSHQKHCAQEKSQQTDAVYTPDSAFFPLSARQAPCTAADQLEGQCASLEKEVHRLERLVVALQEERHQLLENIKHSMFRYRS